jgi:tetratricopeptide (TPR) repeat protein
VTSRGAVMRFKGKALPIRDVARDLAVDAVIEGSVLRSGQSVRISANLILGVNDQNVWAKSYDGDLQDVLKLLNEVSSAIAGEVRARFRASSPAGAPDAPLGTSASVPSPPRVRPDAYEAYLRGRYLFNQSMSAKQTFAAREQFVLATRLDPGFSQGWSLLATTYLTEALFGWGSRPEALSLAREAAQKAIAVAGDDGAGLAVLGMLQLYFDWDFEGARTKLERAVALKPHESLLRHGWADYLMVSGRYDESLDQTRLGRSYDPMSPLAAQVVTFHAMAARRFDDVIADGRLALLVNPTSTSVHGTIGDALWRQQKYDEAAAELKLAAGGDSESWRVFEDSYRRRGPEAALKAYASVIADALVKRGGRAPVAVAAAFAEAGDRDRAILWLERGFAAHEPTMLHVPATVAFDSLRDDPRFQALIRRVGLRMPPLPKGSPTRTP